MDSWCLLDLSLSVSCSLRNIYTHIRQLLVVQQTLVLVIMLVHTPWHLSGVCLLPASLSVEIKQTTVSPNEWKCSLNGSV